MSAFITYPIKPPSVVSDVCNEKARIQYCCKGWFHLPLISFIYIIIQIFQPTFVFLEDMILDKKWKKQMEWVKGDYIYTHLCYVKKVPHPCHFFFLYWYVLTVCQTKHRIQDRNVYIILQAVIIMNLYDSLHVSNTYVIHT